MLNSFKNLRTGNLDACKNDHLYPILRWCSGSIIDLHFCQEINSCFFWLPDDLKKSYMYLGLRDNSPFIKYPKGTKEKTDKKEELKRELALRWLGWSEQELDRTPGTLERLDFDEIATGIGLENSQRKLLGLPIVTVSKIKKQKEKAKPKPKKTLFDF